MVEIQVTVRHNEYVVDGAILGSAEVSELPSIIEALQGAEVYANGTRRIESFQLDVDGQAPTLELIFGDEL